MDKRGYIHTFTPKEQHRLIHQAEYLIPWIHSRVDLSGCNNVLEVGCGVGAQLKILSRRFPEARFTGIDFSPEQIGRAKLLLAEEIAAGKVNLVEGSAYELPFEDESFDCAFFCWVLEHLERPASAVREAARVLRNSGILIDTEVFNAGVYCDPPRAAMIEYWKNFNELQREFGGHPDIGIRLANIALECGLKDVELIDISPHLDGRLSMQERVEMADYFRGIFSSGAAELVKKGRVTLELIDEMEADFDRIAHDPDSIMIYTGFQLHAVRSLD
jgi:ubiquinone/menaquinone biosynthesis C-methylase UbiE